MHIISAPASYSCRLHLIAIWIQYVSSGYVTYMVSWGTNVAHCRYEGVLHKANAYMCTQLGVDKLADIPGNR